MAMELRYTSPENIIYLWNAFQGRDSSPVTKILKYLTNEAEYLSDQAEELISTAHKDGILIGKMVQNDGRSIKSLRIPNLDEIQINEDSYDWYCYECHKPKDLQCCSECLRTFHEKCWRIDPDKPNDSSSIVVNRRYVEKPIIDDERNTSSISNIHNRTTTNENTPDDEVVEIEGDDEENPNQEGVDVIEQQAQQQQPTIKSSQIEAGDVEEIERKNDITENGGKPIEMLESKADIATDVKDIKLSEKEVIYVGEVRPPSRRRRDNRSQSFKAENAANNGADNDEDQEAEDRMLCSCCRVMKKSKFRDPPNMSKDETNYLLRFVFDRVKSWISLDTFSPKSFSNSWAMPSKKHLDIFSKLCFKFPITLSTIDKKLKNKEYTTLSEFQCDFMDLQHCMGILYGSDLHEYQATMYLVSDAIYELSEIRQCRDCYRNSNEKKSNPYWFCKPCIPRHELVFAKQIGYSYWPAKVMRVAGNQYDVRFFGTNHSRAVVDATNVKSIDTDIDELKIKKVATFLKAMDELRKHQELLNLSPGQQSFSLESEIIQTIPIASGSGYSPLNRALGRPRKQFNRQQQKVGSNKRKRRMTCNPVEMLLSPSNDDYIDEMSTAISGNKRAKVPGALEKVTNRNARKSMTGEQTSSSSALASSTVTLKSIQNKTVTSGTEQNKIRTELSANNQQESLVSSTQELCNDPLEMLRQQLSNTKNLKTAKKLALDMFKVEINRLQAKIDRLNDQHKRQISAVKKESWCCYCEKPAIYYCCWNTNYCSTDCQQKHWRSEHKTKCRRKR